MGGAMTVWRDYGLDAVRSLDNLDARIDAVLDTRDAAPEGRIRLAAALGIAATELDRRAGVPVADAVADARLVLIEAACAACRTRAVRADAGLRRAVAVCAVLQWDALGEVGRSARAFAAIGETSGATFADAVRAALALPPVACLARIRALAVAAPASAPAAA